jgi:hypothetical protein
MTYGQTLGTRPTQLKARGCTENFCASHRRRLRSDPSSGTKTCDDGEMDCFAKVLTMTGMGNRFAGRHANGQELIENFVGSFCAQKELLTLVSNPS